MLFLLRVRWVPTLIANKCQLQEFTLRHFKTTISLPTTHASPLVPSYTILTEIRHPQPHQPFLLSLTHPYESRLNNTERTVELLITDGVHALNVARVLPTVCPTTTCTHALCTHASVNVRGLCALVVSCILGGDLKSMKLWVEHYHLAACTTFKVCLTSYSPT